MDKLDKKQVAYIFDCSTQRAYGMVVETPTAALDEIKSRQKEMLGTIKLTWQRFYQVMELLFPNGRVIAADEHVAEYAWSIGWDGTGSVKDWLEQRLEELGKLAELVGSSGEERP